MRSIIAPTVGSLFSGYGGLELGIQQAYPDTQVVWQSEIDDGCKRLLKHHYPDTPNLGDITQINWSTVPHADIICGGSPCQDMSQAGLRAGMKTGTRSGLWEYMRQTIEQLQPDMVVWENVRGALNAPATSLSNVESASGLVGDRSDQPVNRAVGRVLGDLANLGYNASWHGLRASDIGACHHRYRIFLVAVKHDTGLPEWARNIHRTPRVEAGTPHVLPTPTSRDYKDIWGSAKHRPHDTDTLSRALSTVRTGWGEYAPAVNRHEKLVGRPAPQPAIKSASGSMRLNPSFVEWIMCLPENWVCNQGLSRRQELQALGNGVVPIQAAAGIWRAVENLREVHR